MFWTSNPFPSSSRLAVTPWPLAVLTALVMLLAAAGALPDWPGLMHLVALPPLDMLADLRILAVHAPSYPLLLLGTALSLAIRITVLAMMLGSVRTPRFKPAILIYLAALPFYLLGAAAFGAALTTTFYVVFWSAVVGSALVFLLLAAIPWTGGLRGSVAKRGFRAGTLLAYLGLLVLIGMAAELGGTVATVLLVPVSAALTYTAATLLKRRDSLKMPRRVIAALTAGAAIYFVVLVQMDPDGPVEAWPAIESPRPGSLLIMSGIDSRSGLGVIFELNPPLLGFTCEQAYYFSYGGPGEGQPQNDAPCPIRTGAPYGPSDTLRPIEQQAEFFQQQVQELPPPVTVLALSQAVWVAWHALAAGDDLGVRNLILIGTLPQSPVAYPPERDHGPGLLIANALHLITAYAARPASETSFDPAAPLSRDLFASSTAIEALMSQPLPDEVRVLNLTSTFDLPMKPEGWRLDDAVNPCPIPVLHPYLPWSPDALQAMNHFLDQEPNDQAMTPCRWWEQALGPAMLPFGAPPSGAY